MSDEEISRSNGFVSMNPISTEKLATNYKQLREDLPSTKDYRDDDVVTEVKDQGECGSCWTFATAACA